MRRYTCLEGRVCAVVRGRVAKEILSFESIVLGRPWFAGGFFWSWRRHGGQGRLEVLVESTAMSVSVLRARLLFADNPPGERTEAQVLRRGNVCKTFANLSIGVITAVAFPHCTTSEAAKVSGRTQSLAPVILVCLCILAVSMERRCPEARSNVLFLQTCGSCCMWCWPEHDSEDMTAPKSCCAADADSYSNCMGELVSLQLTVCDSLAHSLAARLDHLLSVDTHPAALHTPISDTGTLWSNLRRDTKQGKNRHMRRRRHRHRNRLARQGKKVLQDPAPARRCPALRCLAFVLPEPPTTGSETRANIALLPS